MFKHILLATTLVAAATNVSFAMSDADCTTLANRSDVYAGGKLTDRYAQAAVKAGRTIPADGMINQAGFMEACKADAFKTAAMMPEPGAPLAGANSFTETQAIDRIERAGFKTVTGLKKDDQGIWRASALQGVTPVSIALDFKGNVVAK